MSGPQAIAQERDIAIHSLVSRVLLYLSPNVAFMLPVSRFTAPAACSVELPWRIHRPIHPRSYCGMCDAHLAAGMPNRQLALRLPTLGRVFLSLYLLAENA